MTYSNRNEETTPLLVEEDSPISERKITKESKRNEVAVPSTFRKVLVLLSCIVLHLLAGGTAYALGVIYVELIRVFNSPRTDAALVQTVYMGIMTAGGLLFTRVITKYGPGPCVAGGSIIACFGFVISSFAVNVPMIIVFTGIVAGLGMCVCFLCAFVTCSWMFHSKAAVPLALLTCGNGIGQIVFPYVYDALITEYGWRGTFLLVGAIALHCVPVGVFFFMSMRFLKHGDEIEGDKTTGMCDWSLFKDPLIVFFLLNSFLFSATGNIEMWFIVDIMVIRGYARDVGSFFVSIAGIGNCVGRLGGGAISYCIKIPAVNHWIYSILILAGCHTMIIYRYDYWSTFGTMLIYGIFFGIVASLSPAIMLEAAGLARYPRAIASLNLCNGIGNVVGGLLGGFINDSTGSYNLIFYIAITISAYITLSSIIISCFISKRRARTHSEIKPVVSKRCKLKSEHCEDEIRTPLIKNDCERYQLDMDS